MKVSSVVATAVWLAFASAAALKELSAKTAGATEPIERLAKRGTREAPHFPEPKYFSKSTPIYFSQSGYFLLDAFLISSSLSPCLRAG